MTTFAGDPLSAVISQASSDDMRAGRMRRFTGGSHTNDVVVHVEQDALILEHEVQLALALSRPSLPKNPHTTVSAG